MPVTSELKATTKKPIAGLGIIVFAAMFGCQDSQSNAPSASSVPYVTADEFNTAVAGESDLLLIEFCVPSGCFRCDEMRTQIDLLAEDERHRLKILRVNLHQQPALASQIGVTVCPSYVAFLDGKEVYRAAYPTSADLIFAELDEHLSDTPVE